MPLPMLLVMAIQYSIETSRHGDNACLLPRLQLIQALHNLRAGFLPQSHDQEQMMGRLEELGLGHQTPHEALSLPM